MILIDNYKSTISLLFFFSSMAISQLWLLLPMGRVGRSLTKEKEKKYTEWWNVSPSVYSHILIYLYMSTSANWSFPLLFESSLITWDSTKQHLFSYHPNKFETIVFATRAWNEHNHDTFALICWCSTHGYHSEFHQINANRSCFWRFANMWQGIIEWSR